MYKKPVIVNHGQIFSSNNWYTFYCPNCNKQITREEVENKPCACGCNIKFEGKK